MPSRIQYAERSRACSLASLGIDFVNSEVVDRTQVVSALIPKSYFLDKPYKKAAKKDEDERMTSKNKYKNKYK